MCSGHSGSLDPGSAHPHVAVGAQELDTRPAPSAAVVSRDAAARHTGHFVVHRCLGQPLYVSSKAMPQGCQHNRSSSTFKGRWGCSPCRLFCGVPLLWAAANGQSGRPGAGGAPALRPGLGHPECSARGGDSHGPVLLQVLAHAQACWHMRKLTVKCLRACQRGFCGVAASQDSLRGQCLFWTSVNSGRRVLSAHLVTVFTEPAGNPGHAVLHAGCPTS